MSHFHPTGMQDEELFGTVKSKWKKNSLFCPVLCPEWYQITLPSCPQSQYTAYAYCSPVWLLAFKDVRVHHGSYRLLVHCPYMSVYIYLLHSLNHSSHIISSRDFS